jgi:hypothetical protein
MGKKVGGNRNWREMYKYRVINYKLVTALMEASRKLMNPMKNRSSDYFRDDLMKIVAAFPHEARKIWINFFFNFDAIKRKESISIIKY